MDQRDDTRAPDRRASSRRTFLRRLVAAVVGTALGLVACAPKEEAMVTRYRYDAKGRVATRTLPSGTEVGYTYDKAGLAKISDSSAVRITRDLAGAIATVEGTGGTTRYHRDADGRVTAVIDANGRALRYASDPWGRVVTLSPQDGEPAHFEHTMLNQLRTATLGAIRVETSFEPAKNSMVRRYSNGVTSIFETDASGRLVNISHNAATGAAICGFRYTYDALDRVAEVEERSNEKAEVTRYTYDLAGRLTREGRSDGAITQFEYDLMGNRISESNAGATVKYGYDRLARLVTAGTAAFRYDAAGNITSRKDDTSGTAEYRYDDNNHLVEVRVKGKTIRYRYDATGTLVAREVDGRRTEYLVDTLRSVPQVIAQRGTGGAAQYLVGAARYAKRDASGKSVYFLEDRLGSTRCVVDDAGRLVARYAYSVFGVPNVVEGTSQTDYLFAGEHWDADARLIFLRNRFYDPALGRFLSVDPIRGSLTSPTSFNQYVYANGDPVNSVDPLGLQALGCSPYQINCSNSTWSVQSLHGDRQDVRLFAPAPQMPTYPTFQYPPSWVSPTAPTAADWYRPFTQDQRQINEQAWVTQTPPPQTPSQPRTPTELAQAANRQWTYGVLLSGAGLASAVVPFIVASPAAAIGAACVGLACQVASYRLERDRVGMVKEVVDFAATLGTNRIRSSIAGSWSVFSTGLEAYDLAQRFTPTDRRDFAQGFGAVSGTIFMPFTQALRPAGAMDQVVGALGAASRNLLVDYRMRGALDNLLAPSALGSLHLPTNGGATRGQNNFPFPPGGDGSGAVAFPRVGGVWLDQSLKLIGELGSISGADIDPATGRLTLIGDKTTTLPPIKPQYLAAAIRAVSLPSDQEPGMTIDPLPENPTGPVMKVVFFGNTAQTELGFFMFECDRVMKGMSVSNDNVTGEPVTSSVPGFRSVTDMRFEAPESGPDLWSRFWLVPAPVSARTSADGRTIVFDPVRLTVKTETMRWQAGKLVSAGGVKDEHAQAFADWLTRNYDALAAERPVFAELKQVTLAVALAKWLRAQAVPIDPNLVDALLGDPYPTPNATPSARAVRTATSRVGNSVRSRMLQSIGGVEMKPTLVFSPSKSVDAAQKLLRVATQSVRADGHLPTVSVEGRDRPVLSLPLNPPRELASLRLTESDLASATQDEVTAGLPSLSRHYDSTHNRRTEFGFGWTLLLPRLVIEDVREDGGIRHLTLPGSEQPKVRLQRFTLTNAHGIGEERFVEQFVDQAVKRIGFAPSADKGRFRGLYPEDGNAYRVVFANGDQAVFDLEGRLRGLFADKAKTLYDYDATGGLTTIRRAADGKSEMRVTLRHDAAGRIESASHGGDSVTYGYDAKGNLTSVKTGRGTAEYRYDDQRVLIDSRLDGKLFARYAYDPRGRLVSQTDGAGNTVDQKTEVGKSGVIVTLRAGDRSMRREFDADLRLRSTSDDSGVRHDYSYGPDGGLAQVALVAGGGQRETLRISPDRRTLRVQDAQGHTTEFQLSDAGRVDTISRDGRTLVLYQRDGQGRLIAADYGAAGRETAAYDRAGRLVRLARQAGGPQGTDEDHVELAYDPQGRPVAVKGPGVGVVEYRWEADGVAVKQNGASIDLRLDADGRPRSVRRADGEVRRFEYSASGQIQRIQVERGRGSATATFADGRLVSTRDALGGEFRFTYDSAGRLGSATDPIGARAEYVYDAQDRLIRAKLSDGRCVSLEYVASTGQTTDERIAPCQR